MKTAICLTVSLLLAGQGSRTVLAETLPPAALRSSQPYADHIAAASRRFGVPKAWICAVLHAESHGQLRAVSSAGAMGLMQIMPGTWQELRDRHGLGRDPFAPRDNILAGAAYLGELHVRFGAPGFLAAYNAGPGRYDDYLTRGRPLPAETMAYVAAIAPQLGMRSLPGKHRQRSRTDSDPARARLFIARDHYTAFAAGPPSGERSEGASPQPPGAEPAPGAALFVIPSQAADQAEPMCFADARP